MTLKLTSIAYSEAYDLAHLLEGKGLTVTFTNEQRAGDLNKIERVDLIIEPAKGASNG